MLVYWYNIWYGLVNSKVPHSDLGMKVPYPLLLLCFKHYVTFYVEYIYFTVTSNHLHKILQRTNNFRNITYHAHRCFAARLL